MAKINVLVVVDTVNINANNLMKTVTLIDDNLDSDATCGDSKTFTIKAKSGDEVKFRITAVNQKTKVKFQEFIWEAGEHCFDPLPCKDNKWKGTAKGNPGDHENFGIKFSVKGNEGSPFTLDPDIQLDPPG